MKFIAGLRVWVNGAMGKTPQVFPKIRGSANRRVDLHLPLIASIPGDCGWDPEGGGRLNAEGGGVASDGRIEELDQVKISAFLLA